MTTAWQRSPDLSNPRAQRTHEHVLAVARAMLTELGPKALTFSALGERAHVTRQTLYRHWSTRDELLAEVVTTGPDVGYPSPGDDAREVITAFLTTLRDGLADPPSIASLLSITAEAGSDPVVATTLTTISEDRRRALNVLLEPAEVSLGTEDFARVVGPVLYSVLFARQPVTDALILAVAESWVRDQESAAER